MATFPQLANPYSSSLRRSVRGDWIPVLFALVFVAFTSTSFMGGSHTQVFVIAVWRAVFGGWHLHWAVEANQIGRKIGHFLGYGVIGLLFRKAWFVTMRAYAMIGNRLILFSSTLGVASTFLLASLDEWHQRFLPGRVGCFRDVMIDTSGAVFLTFVLLGARMLRRRMMLSSCLAIRSPQKCPKLVILDGSSAISAK